MTYYTPDQKISPDEGPDDDELDRQDRWVEAELDRQKDER
jgi:hypothetical protein